MTYPDKLCVIVPHIQSLCAPFSIRSERRPLVFLRAFAALMVHRSPDGRLSFAAHYRHDEVGNASVDLLIEACDLFYDHEVAIAAWRLGEVAAMLNQVPLGSDREIPGKVATLHVRDAILRQPIDAALLDASGGKATLTRVALANDLCAEWDKPAAVCNPVRLRRQLVARAESMWLAIAKTRLPAFDFTSAALDLFSWKEAQLID